MKQLDLFTHPDLEEILSGPGGDMIGYCFNDSNSPEELKSQVKAMLDGLMNAKDVSSRKEEYANYGIRSIGDFKQFKDNVFKVMNSPEELLNYYKHTAE